MLNIRRGFKLVTLAYSIHVGSTQVGKLMPGFKFSLISDKVIHPFAQFSRSSLFYYCSSLNFSSLNDPLIEHDDGDDEVGCCNDETGCDNDEIECGNDEEGEVSGEDDEVEFPRVKSGLGDVKLNHEVRVVLQMLRGQNPSKDVLMDGVRGSVSGVEVAQNLKECGVSPTVELVEEVLSRTRNDWEVAFMFFLWAGRQSGYAHSLKGYHSMISILAKRRKFDTAWSLIDEMRKKGIVNPNTLLIMIRRYSAAHDVANAINTFHAFKRFDFLIGVEEFHQLLSALTRYKNVQEAEHLLFSNKNTFQFNTKSFNIILNGWCNIVCCPREANRFWRLMNDHGIKLDVISYSSIILKYSKWNKVKDVMRLFGRMKEIGIDPDRKVYNAVIHALAKGGQAKEALNLLCAMKTKGIAPTVVTFNSMIQPLCKNRMRDEAQKVYDEMLSQGVQPTIRTFHAFLRIQRTGEEIFLLLDKMKELGCYPNKDTYQLLIRKFCRWRQLDKVFMLWDQMKEKGWNDDNASYISLIHGLFLNGKLEEAHKIYLEMKGKSFLPNAKTDELIQTWLSNKKMAESQMITSDPSLVDGDHVSRIGKGSISKLDRGKDLQSQPEFRKVVREQGVSFWD